MGACTHPRIEYQHRFTTRWGFTLPGRKLNFILQLQIEAKVPFLKLQERYFSATRLTDWTGGTEVPFLQAQERYFEIVAASNQFGL